MANVFYRNPRHHYPTGMRGEGVYLYDSGGKQYLDSSGGAAVSCLGHGHPVVIEAIKAQLDKLAYAHTAFFTNEPQEKMAGRLAERLGDQDARVYFLSGGSEANETAIKIARQYAMAKGHDGKHVIVSRKQSYHGNTLGALSASGNLGRRKIFAPLLHDWPKIEPCYAYRHRQADESEEDYGRRVADSLEAAILEAGPENVSAFMAETVVGATIGAVPPVPGYFARIREICDQYDVLLILDEVMAGCGRSGTYFAFEQDGVMPDMVTIAKGLGGGYQAIGAVIAAGHVHDSIVETFGSFEHGHTYIGHATACATALAISGLIDEYDLLDRVTNTGEALQAALGDAFAEHPNVGDIRGRGLLLAIELVADRETKEPAPAKVAAQIKDEAMAQGLIIYPGGGTADGTHGAHILLAPPFIYEPRHVDELVSKLVAVIDTVSFEP
jgi:adenosylmethionine-8-amino-7-oxononanoate aminotransferase